MKKIIFILFFLNGIVPVLKAQDRQIQGIVFDESNKQRLNKVYVYNTRTDKGVYNNSKGEFTMTVQKGDTIVVALQGYIPDTATVQSQNVVLFYLKSLSILLQEVKITDSSRIAPGKARQQAREDFKEIYRTGSSKDILNVSGGKVGLGIDAIYNLLSRQGKNARFLQKIIERDYHDAIVDYRFTKGLVTNVTSLTGEKLRDFMLQYRPTYYFVLQASEYVFVESIKMSYASYLRNPGAHRMPTLRSN